MYIRTMYVLHVERLHRLTKIMTSLLFTPFSTKNEFMLMAQKCFEFLCKLSFSWQKLLHGICNSTNTVEPC